mgnify:FL=1
MEPATDSNKLKEIPNIVDLIGWKCELPVNHNFPTIMICGDCVCGDLRAEASVELGAIGSEDSMAGAPLFQNKVAYAPHVRLRFYYCDKMLFSVGLDQEACLRLLNYLGSAHQDLRAAETQWDFEDLQRSVSDLLQFKANYNDIDDPRKRAHAKVMNMHTDEERTALFRDAKLEWIDG